MRYISDTFGHYAAITPHAATNIADGSTHTLYVGVAGDVAAVRDDDTVVTFKALPVGFHDIRVKRVNAIGTSATDMVACYPYKGWH